MLCVLEHYTYSVYDTLLHDTTHLKEYFRIPDTQWYLNSKLR